MKNEPRQRRPWFPSVAALVLVAAAFGLHLLLKRTFGWSTPAGLMLLAVVGVTWIGGRKPGLFATALATCLTAWSLFNTEGSLQVSRTAEWIGLVTFFVAGVLLSLMGPRFRSLASRDERGGSPPGPKRDVYGTLDTLSEGLICVDRNWRFTYINSAAARALQRTPDELRGRNLWEEFPHDVGTPLAEHFKRTMDAREHTQFEHYCAALDVWHEYRLHPSEDGITVLLVDVTEQKRTMEALRRSEEEFRLLAESVPQLVWRADPNGAVKYYSRSIHDFAGAPRISSGSLDWRPMIHPDDQAATTKAWADAVRTGSAYSVEHRIRMADGSYHWHLTRAFPSRSSDGNIVRWFGTATDIHDQKTAVHDLDELVQRKTAELQATVAELESMSYSIVHDMRAPLRSIIGFSRVIAEEEGGRLTEEGRSILNRLCSAASRLDALIRDVLAYTAVSRTDELMEPVDCEALLHEIVTDYPNLFGANIEFHPPFPPVMGNRAWLTQVFSNILGNAAKFVGPGVTPHIRIHADADAPLCRYWFEDNGIGIPENIQKRLFNIFQRGHTQAEYPGTGIGLAIVRRAVERMGGRCGVESRIGHGSRFWIELPLAQSSSPARIATPVEAPVQRTSD